MVVFLSLALQTLLYIDTHTFLFLHYINTAWGLSSSNIAKSIDLNKQLLWKLYKSIGKYTFGIILRCTLRLLAIAKNIIKPFTIAGRDEAAMYEEPCNTEWVNGSLNPSKNKDKLSTQDILTVNMCEFYFPRNYLIIRCVSRFLAM